MSEEQPPGDPERPEAQPPGYPIGQPPGSNPQGHKPFWRRTPFLMAAPPLTLVMIVTIVAACGGTHSASGSPSASAGSPSAAAGSPSASAGGSPSAAAGSPSAAAGSPSASPTSYPDCTSHACIAAYLDQNLTGLVAVDKAVSTKVTCYVSTVVYYAAAGTYSAHCTVTYSDGSSAYGIGNLVTSSGQVTFEPT
jgi:hypothetical protein